MRMCQDCGHGWIQHGEYRYTDLFVLWCFRVRARSDHGSSEGHEMLKRNDKCHSIADDVPIPKM